MIFVSNIVSFVLGLVSAFLIDRYRDRKNARRELSREVYGPLHFELTTHVLENVVRHARSGCTDHSWRQIKAKGLAKLVPLDLRQQIETFYSDTLPRYEIAWQVCHTKISEYREQWDDRYGAPPGGTNQVDINWFDFLISRECNLPHIDLREGDALRLFNYSIRSHRFRDWMPIEQFLTERWQENTHDPAIVDYRDSYDRIINQSKLIIENLQAKICV